MRIPQYLPGNNETQYNALLNQVLTTGVGYNGFQITSLTGAQITMLTSMDFIPVLPAGTMFFNSDVPAWQGVSVAAVPAISNATIVTFTTA